jgi:hypothetical protein
VNPERLIELGQQRRGQAANPPPDPFDRYGADLLGLGRGVVAQAGLAGGQQHLEGIDPLRASMGFLMDKIPRAIHPADGSEGTTSGWRDGAGGRQRG